MKKRKIKRKKNPGQSELIFEELTDKYQASSDILDILKKINFYVNRKLPLLTSSKSGNEIFYIRNLLSDVVTIMEKL